MTIVAKEDAKKCNARLYHDTSPKAVKEILKDGLRFSDRLFEENNPDWIKEPIKKASDLLTMEPEEHYKKVFFYDDDEFMGKTFVVIDPLEINKEDEFGEVEIPCQVADRPWWETLVDMLHDSEAYKDMTGASQEQFEKEIEETVGYYEDSFEDYDPCEKYGDPYGSQIFCDGPVRPEAVVEAWIAGKKVK